MNKDLQNSSQVTDFLGKAFIKMPRKLLNLSLHPEKKKCQLARIYMALITLSFFRDGIVMLGKNKHVCRRGEYVGTYLELARFTAISLGSVGYYLKILEMEKLIVLNAVRGGTRIGICNYDLFFGHEPEMNGGQDASAGEAGRRMADVERTMGGRNMQDMNPEERGNA